MAKSEYVIVAEKKYEISASVVRNKDNGKEYLNFDLTIDGKRVALSLRNYNEFTQDYVVSDIKKK